MQAEPITKKMEWKLITDLINLQSASESCSNSETQFLHLRHNAHWAVAAKIKSLKKTCESVFICRCLHQVLDPILQPVYNICNLYNVVLVCKHVYLFSRWTNGATHIIKILQIHPETMKCGAAEKHTPLILYMLRSLTLILGCILNCNNSLHRHSCLKQHAMGVHSAWTMPEYTT